MSVAVSALPGVAPSDLGESPFWHPHEAALYWVDIPGFKLHRFEPRTQAHAEWAFPTDVGCAAPLAGGGLLLALRDGLWRFDPASGRRDKVADAPYDSARLRFNDGKADPQPPLGVGTYDMQREPVGALYRWDEPRLERVLDGVAVSNGLAWSPDGRTMYWADTPRHEVWAFDFDATSGAVANRRSFARFEPRAEGRDYRGRPDGAAVDSEGAYWVAMFEGARLLRIAPDGTLLQEVMLPAQCPTMPCFGGADLKTLYVTTARLKRPADELARRPLSGCVLQLRVEVPGLPVHFANG
jgi:sugar lactone lactonase YvrE